MATLHIYLFGTPRVELDGTAIHIERRKVMALLAYLSVSPQSHSRDALATLLWPGYGQSEARAHLRRALSTLTKTVGKEWFEISRQHIEMVPQSGLWIDVVAFEEGLYSARSDSDSEEQLTAWETAVALYTEDFMYGFSLSDSADFDDWQTIQAAQLRQHVLTILQALVQGYSGLGSAGYDAAVRYAQRWLALDPLYELAHRYLMQLYTWRGDRVAALAQYQECVRLLREELDVEPEEATQEIFAQIRSGALSSDAAVALSLASDLLPPPAAPPRLPTLPAHNLPTQFTTFCGRTAELEQLQTLVTDGTRWITIAGEGGIGKSRLAVAAAHELLDHFAQHIWFVSLADFDSSFNSTADRSSQQKLAATIMEMLDMKPETQEGQSMREQLLAGLPSVPMLLLLDGFELALPAADLIIDMLQHRTELYVWITSTEPLGFQAETLMRLSGLAVPEAASAADDGVQNLAALQLFSVRAQQHTVTFTIDATNLADIVRICQLVSGSPLGIELAAVWTEYFTCAEIAAALQKQDLDLLSVSYRDVPKRHRSLRNIFTYSWSLLHPAQQQILARLSVFRGVIERTAAQAVAGCSLPDLIALFQKSLLYQVRPGCFEMHRLLRGFAREQLAQLDPTEETLERHAAYFLRFVHSQEKILLGLNAEPAQREIQRNIENIRAAWHWAADHARSELLCNAALALARYYQQKGLYYESMDLLSYAVQNVRRLRQETASDASRAELTKAEQLLHRLITLSLRRRRRNIPDLDLP